MRRFDRNAVGGLLAAVLVWPVLASAEDTAAKPAAMLQQPALKRAYAGEEMLLAVARAGQRLVAVGDHGVVLLSDDEGKTYRQAQAVPTRATLTAVSFVDAKNGWAVGHWGAIMHSADGGETWTLQRSDTSVDRPLFSVYFADAGHGLAVGLWSLLLATADGGKTWNEVKLSAPPEGGKADRNLFAIFTNGRGSIFIAAEKGTVLRSDDLGATWSYLNTGYKGSFWTGCALKDGTLLVGGLRGTIYRSVDNGRTWGAASSGTQSSITGLLEDGTKVHAVGLDGVHLVSSDGGMSFSSTQRDDRLSLTAAAASITGELREFSRAGVVKQP
jgi:photosystem II stability/assembly factor-like uncharacterized protein